MVDKDSSGSDPPQVETVPTEGDPITDLEKIIKFDEQLWDVTRGLPIKLGSILRIPSSSLLNWNIEVTEGNRDELMALSKMFYDKDFDDDMHSRSSCDKEELMLTRLSQSIENRMRRAIVSIVSELALSPGHDHKKPLVIADISAKSASLALDIVGELFDITGNPTVHKKLEFHIVHPSASRLDSTRHLLKDLGIGAKSYLMDPDEYLAEQDPGSLDFIVSMPCLHKKSFPVFPQHMHEALVPGGAAVIGDIHSTLSHNPYNIYKLLGKMGIDPRRLEIFRELFGSFLIEQSYSGLSMDELHALNTHMSEWCEISENLRKSRRTGNQRVLVLGAHDTSKERTAKFESAGFMTNADDIRKAFNLSKYDGAQRRIEKSDYAVVMVAAKHS